MKKYSTMRANGRDCELSYASGEALWNFENSDQRRAGEHRVGKKINEKFMNAYMELDRQCCEKFGVPFSGVTEYINRLNNARFAPGREDVLPRLVKYRNLRNRFAHEIAAMRRFGDVGGEDIKWIKHFSRMMQKRRDPMSIYFIKARRYARRRAISRIVTAVASAMLVVIILLAVILLALK